MSSRSAWLRLWFVWAAPAVLVIANGVWLLGLRSAVLGRGSLLMRQQRNLQTDVAALLGKRDSLAGARRALDTLQGDLGTLRKVQLGSMRERLVSFLVDVAKRTRASGLNPDQISYAASSDPKTGMVHFTANFSVTGTYEEIRRCVNLLEASPQFVLVERLGLRTEEGASSLAVDVQLAVGTYFVDADTGMLRELGIEDVPASVAAGATPSAPASAAEPAAETAPRGEFASVDEAVMQDLRSAVSDLGNAEQPDEDIFVTPEPVSAPSRRDRSRAAASRREQANSFITQVGRREVSGGR